MQNKRNLYPYFTQINTFRKSVYLYKWVLSLVFVSQGIKGCCYTNAFMKYLLGLQNRKKYIDKLI